MERLTNYLRELRTSDLASFVVIDGSFVTAKDEPEDVDMIVVLRKDHDFGADLRPFEYNVLSYCRERAYGESTALTFCSLKKISQSMANMWRSSHRFAMNLDKQRVCSR